jgi:hypothetical protein
MYEYSNGETPIDSALPARYQHLFNFRVREIRFAPDLRTRAYAVTDGCCSANDSTDIPSVLTYSDFPAGSGFYAGPGWIIHSAAVYSSFAGSGGSWDGQDTVPSPDPGVPADILCSPGNPCTVPDVATKQPAGQPVPVHQSGAQRARSTGSTA